MVLVPWAAIQTVRKHAQQMRTRDVGMAPFSTVLSVIAIQMLISSYSKPGSRNASSDARRGPALVHWFEDRVISGEAGLRTQQLPRYSERGFPIRQFAQFGCVQGGLQHARQRRVFAAVARNQIEIPTSLRPSTLSSMRIKILLHHSSSGFEMRGVSMTRNPAEKIRRSDQP